MVLDRYISDSGGKRARSPVHRVRRTDERIAPGYLFLICSNRKF